MFHIITFLITGFYLSTAADRSVSERAGTVVILLQLARGSIIVLRVEGMLYDRLDLGWREVVMHVRVARVQQRGDRLTSKLLGATAINIKRIAQAPVTRRVYLEYRPEPVSILERLAPLVPVALPICVRATCAGWWWRRRILRVAVMRVLVTVRWRHEQRHGSGCRRGRAVRSARESTHCRSRIRRRLGQAHSLCVRYRLTRSQRAIRVDVAQFVVIERNVRERRSTVGEHVRPGPMSFAPLVSISTSSPPLTVIPIVEPSVPANPLGP
jgi:hypothetical protein